jgi:phage terminase large subunit
MTREVIQRVKVTDIYRKTLASNKITVVNSGGARSSKSYSLMQIFTQKFVAGKNQMLGITRKTMPALKMSTYDKFMTMLWDYGISRMEGFNHDKTYNLLTLGTNQLQFFSLDNPERIKSTDFNYIWMEEANEFSYEDYLVLLTRLSTEPNPGNKNQMYLSLNPSDGNSWVYDLERDIDAEFIHSTYKNNPFLSEQYINNILLKLKEKDMNAYRVFAMGLKGRREGIIYPDYKLVDNFPDNLDETFYGIDFGFNDAMAVVELGRKEDDIYVDQVVYESGLTTAKLIKLLNGLNLPKNACYYADSAEPDRIEEIEDAGYNVYPAKKGKNSVCAGIDKVKSHNLFVTKKSVNIIKEISDYAWRKDRNSRILDEPVKYNDHAMDAIRMAIFTHIKSNAILSVDHIKQVNTDSGVAKQTVEY